MQLAGTTLAAAALEGAGIGDLEINGGNTTSGVDDALKGAVAGLRERFRRRQRSASVDLDPN